MVTLTFLPNFKKIEELEIFSAMYALCYIFYLYGSEMYRLHRTKLYDPVMIELYKENVVMLEIMG